MDSQETGLSEEIKNTTVAEPSPVQDSGFVSLDVPSNVKSCGVSADIQIVQHNFGCKTVKTDLNDLDESSSKPNIPEQVTGLEFWQQPYDFFFEQDSDGDTQLHIAIAMRMTEAAHWLINVVPHAYMLDHLNHNSHSPLHLAVLNQEPLLVRRLIVAGANPEARSAVGNTPLHLACALGYLDCVRALTESLTPAENELSRQSHVLPQNLDTINYNGKTCLHIAAANGHVDIVEQLLCLGANINIPEGQSGLTCVHIAIEWGHLEVVRHLSQHHRACLEAVTYAGVTTYQLAMEHNPELANELAEQYGLARIVQEDNISDSSSNEGNSVSSSDDECMSSDDSQMSDDQSDMYQPMMAQFLNRDWVTTRMRST